MASEAWKTVTTVTEISYRLDFLSNVRYLILGDKTTLVEVYQMTNDTQTDGQSKELLREALQEVFVEQDLSAIDRYYANDLIQHSEGVPEGADGLKTFFEGLYAGFPDLTPTVDHIHAEDDRAFAFLTWNGTHDGEFMGVEPTGEAITLRTAELMRVEDRKIVEHWDVVDQSGMLATLGLVTVNHPQLE